MALDPSFSVSQNSGSPSNIGLTDTSTGGDVTVTKRRIFLLQSDGTYLVPNGTTSDYIEWDLSSTTINLNVLSEDTALQITVQWLNISNAIVYTVTSSFGFRAYGETFYYGLSDGQVPIVFPLLPSSIGYYYNKMLLRVFLDSASQAISFASDIYKAQAAFELSNNMIKNQKIYF